MTTYDATVRRDAADLTALDGLIGHATVQGVPVLHAPRPGDISAGLLFRVGRADETLSTSGVTHLVEHLALHRLGVSDVHYNGATANTYTHFHVTGDEDEVVTYLNDLCASLRDLPLDRLETEKEILRTEAAGRANGPNSQMPLWRYGAQGYGLSSYDELGTWSLTADQVQQWAETRFTRDNAVLWMTSDHVPDGLDLTLPAGRRIPAPAASGSLPVTPAYIRGEDGHVVFDSVLRRSTAAAVFADILGRALFRDLRQEGGYSYTAEAHYSPRDADFATLTAYADALPEKQDAVVGAFVDTLAGLRAGRLDQAELDSVRGKLLKRYDTPDLGAARLPSDALSLLLGHEILSPEQHKAELEAVTVADLREIAREAWDGGLFQVPARGADWAGFTLAPQYSSSAVAGTRHQSLDSDGVTLVIGGEGVSLLLPGGPVTVRYDACAAMTARPDGARLLTGLDGFRVALEPTLFRDVTAERIAVLDEAVPAAAVVPLPARDPERVPQPREREMREAAPVPQGGGDEARKSASPGLRHLPVWFVLLVVAEVVFGLGLLIAILQTSDSAHEALIHLTRAMLPTALVIAYTRKAYRHARRDRG
ncbi:M16 family metallopeptidase [Streptomyces sp. NPDC101165]|uniref:M16 family metallopeptidase n=1 Tax=Streptomyces sp. NPDC101165 TaxID=3366119 RepID=UPI0037FBA49E